ncbi:AMIN-like domain-containing (lipo)protein [Saccharomonospora iraqiensis]|uniref:AMIN-like domain-containing (lipo)protein n=1 Tax=Saccharomonospora iraqiensis TaxID=52698 RepID=UPI00022E205E|nr:hypothetical protein [Saccharomonospora iraqiensis]
MRRIAGTAAAVALLAVGACGGDTAEDATPAPDGTTTSADGGPSSTTATTEPPAPSSAPVSPADRTPSAASCDVVDGWNERPDEVSGSSGDELFRTRVGQHPCFDRVVFDVRGMDEPGGLVRYEPVVRADGSGKEYPVEGDATLRVVVRSSIEGFPDGPPALGNVGDVLHPTDELAGWEALREIRYAGFFEGQATIAVGVDEKAPFRAFTVHSEDEGVSKLVVDVAHEPS